MISPKLPMPSKTHAHHGECAHQIGCCSQHIMHHQRWLVGGREHPLPECLAQPGQVGLFPSVLVRGGGERLYFTREEAEDL